MPVSTTPYGTTQPWIPGSDRNQRNRYPGTLKGFVDVAALAAACTVERSNIEMGLPVWFQNERLECLDEPPGVARLWTLGTGGSSAANAAGSHARRVLFGLRTALLGTNTANKVHATTGTPASGAGIAGDLALDAVAGNVYEKASTTWSLALVLYGGGTQPEAVAPGAVTNLQAGANTQSTQVLTWNAPTTGTAPISYQPAYRLGSSTGAYTDFGPAISATTVNIQGLTAGTMYDYKVTPINSAGVGTAALLNDVSTAGGVGADVDIHVSDFSANTASVIDLIAFTPQQGGPWVKQVAASYGDVTGQAVVTTTGYVRGPNSPGTASLAYTPGKVSLPSSGGTRGYARFHIFSNSTDFSVGLYLRSNNATAANTVMAMYKGGTFTIVKRVGTAETTLASLAVPAIVVGNDVEMEFRAAQGVQKLFYRMLGDTPWILACSAAEPDSGFNPGDDVGVRFSSVASWSGTDIGPRLRIARFGTCAEV